MTSSFYIRYYHSSKVCVYIESTLDIQDNLHSMVLSRNCKHSYFPSLSLKPQFLNKKDNFNRLALHKHLFFLLSSTDPHNVHSFPRPFNFSPNFPAPKNSLSYVQAGQVACVELMKLKTSFPH